MSNEGSSSEGVDGDGRVMNDTTMPPPARGSAAQVGDVAPIPLRKIGQFGLSEWMRLLASSKDLAQRKGKPLRKIRWDEIRQHKSIHDGWIVLKNKVYFISPYVAYHPGGKVILMGVLGKDATTLFNKYHLWVNEDG